MRIVLTISLFLTLFLVAAPVIAAEQVQPPNGWKQASVGPAAHAEKFLDLMVAGQLDDAFKALLGKSKSDSLDKLKFEIYRTYQKSGKPNGYERVLTQKAGKSLLKLRYVLRFKNLPMMFDIYYYNPGNAWRLRTFTYSTDVKKIFAQ